MAIDRLLWAFNIKSANGKEVEIKEKSFTMGFVSVPNKDAVFEIRSNKHNKFVEGALQIVEKIRRC
jgi:hypothetical protein